MSGRLPGSADGQLALADATVFFVASILISTTLLAYVEMHADTASYSDQFRRRNADQVLDVFLHTSIGLDLILDLNPSVNIQSNDEVVECISVETQAIKGGASAESFCALNEAYLRILWSCTHRLYQPYLVVIHPGDNETETILAIPELPEDLREAQAGCVEIPDNDNNTSVLVQLVLCPASSPELM